MTSLHLVTVRTAAAIGRLSNLRKRAERVSGSGGSVLKAALKELTEALDELQFANEHVKQQVDMLAGARVTVNEVTSRFDEFADVLPVACVWTDDSGLILQANGAAASLLNVSSQHLEGRPLMLFVTDRDKFMEAQGALNQQLTMVVDVPLILRPRERRPRNVRLIGRRLQYDDRRCWFVQPAESESAD